MQADADGTVACATFVPGGGVDSVVGSKAEGSKPSVLESKIEEPTAPNDLSKNHRVDHSARKKGARCRTPFKLYLRMPSSPISVR